MNFNLLRRNTNAPGILAALAFCSVGISNTHAQNTSGLIQVRNPNTIASCGFTFDSPGSLLLCGGSKLPVTILDTFFKYGGAENGELVIIPTASPQSDSKEYSRWVSMWKDYRWKKVSVVHTLHRVDGDEATSIVDSIRSANAVWIAGGDQQRLVDRYFDTSVLTELKELLARGGIIGGTSAGAAVASNVMIAGGVTVPKLGKGWGLLDEVIIDQHFSQRARFERLTEAVQRNPAHVGLGLDEATGVLISNNQMQVVGSGNVYFISAADNYAEEANEAKRIGHTLVKFAGGSRLDVARKLKVHEASFSSSP